MAGAAQVVLRTALRRVPRACAPSLAPARRACDVGPGRSDEGRGDDRAREHEPRLQGRIRAAVRRQDARDRRPVPRRLDTLDVAFWAELDAPAAAEGTARRSLLPGERGAERHRSQPGRVRVRVRPDRLQRRRSVAERGKSTVRRARHSVPSDLPSQLERTSDRLPKRGRRRPWLRPLPLPVDHGRAGAGLPGLCILRHAWRRDDALRLQPGFELGPLLEAGAAVLGTLRPRGAGLPSGRFDRLELVREPDSGLAARRRVVPR